MEERINNLLALRIAVTNKRAVICPSSRCFRGPRPAAFMINLSGEILLRLFGGGMYIYKKKVK